MSIRTRKIAVFLSAASLVGATGIGVAQGAASSSSSGTSSAAKQRGPGGPGRHHPRLTNAQIAQIAQNLGVPTDALKSALDANKPAKADGPRGGPAQLAADLAAKLGVSTSAVQEILDANRPPRPATRPARGTMPPKPDFSKLISALAAGLNIDQSTVQASFDELDAAHKADETARRTAMNAAIAKSLGVSTDAVQSAFAAVLPAPPAG
jgi:hypothetical protein